MARLAYSLFLALIALISINGTSFADDNIACKSTTTERRILMWEKAIDIPLSATEFETCSRYLQDIYYKSDKSGYVQGGGFNYSSNPYNNPILIKVQQDFEKLKSNYAKKPKNNPSSSFDSGFLTEAEFIVDRLINCTKIGAPDEIKNNHHSALVSEAFKIWFDAMNTVGIDGLLLGERYKRVLGELQPTLEFYNKKDELGLINESKALLDKVREKEEFWYKNRPCKGVTPPNKCANPITEEYFEKFIKPNKDHPSFKKDYELYMQYKAMEDGIESDKAKLNKKFNELVDPYTPPPSPEELAATTPPPLVTAPVVTTESIPPPPQAETPTTAPSIAAPTTTEPSSPQPPSSGGTPPAVPSPPVAPAAEAPAAAVLPPPSLPAEIPITTPSEAPPARGTGSSADDSYTPPPSPEEIATSRRADAKYTPAPPQPEKVKKSKEQTTTETLPTPPSVTTPAKSNESAAPSSVASKKGGKQRKHTTVRTPPSTPPETASPQGDEATDSSPPARQEKEKKAKTKKLRAPKTPNDYYSRLLSFIVNYRNGNTQPYDDTTWKTEVQTDLSGWKTKINKIKDINEKKKEQRRFNGTLRLLEHNLGSSGLRFPYPFMSE